MSITAYSEKNQMSTPRNSSINLDKFKPVSEKFEFREYPFYWIIRLGNRYSQEMEKMLKQVDMNITSWRVGMILKENGTLSMSEIATHAAARLPTINKTVYRMQSQGLVEVRQNKKDGRIAMVEITKQGRKKINHVIKKTSRTIDRAFEGMNTQQLTQMNDLLKIVFSNLSDH